MPWRLMRLRGQRVLARCDEQGQLVQDEGRVEIRYKPQDGRAYRAAVRNLETIAGDILPDSHCGPGETPQSTGAAGVAKGKTKPSGQGDLPTEPNPGEALAYADGACSGNPGPAGLGAVLITEHSRQEISEYLGQGTNNVAELMAILRTAEAADPSIPLTVYTDSKYSIGVLTGAMRAKKNKELIAKAQAALSRLEKWSLRYVPGHAGVELNERADELAVLAVQDRASTGWRDAQ